MTDTSAEKWVEWAGSGVSLRDRRRIDGQGWGDLRLESLDEAVAMLPSRQKRDVKDDQDMFDYSSGATGNNGQAGPAA